MRTLGTTVSIAVASLLLVQPCKANKERPRSLEEMQASSGIILDGTVTDVTAKHKPTQSNEQGYVLVPYDYEASFKVERILKGQIGNQSVILVYSRVSDPRFKGDNPPELKVGDRFRLFADTVESSGPPTVIRVRSLNAVRPEAVETSANSALPTTQHTPSSSAVPPSVPVIANKLPMAPPILTTAHEEPASSTPWSIIVVLIMAACGLLWLLLKRRWK
jgi:hypothetical protein